MTENVTPLTSNRPYLLRAIYEWLLDNNLTPQVLVDALQSGVQVPQQHIKDGQILLNISNSAVQNLLMENHGISFTARFSGSPMNINIPTTAILAIFARENGQGMAFPDEPAAEALIDEVSVDVSVELTTEFEKKDSGSDNDNPERPPKKKSKPTLKIVK